MAKKDEQKKVTQKKSEGKNTKTISKKEADKANVKKSSFIKDSISELKKVRWPSKKEMIKNSTAVILFVLFFAVYFYLIELIVYLVKMI